MPHYEDEFRPCIWRRVRRNGQLADAKYDVFGHVIPSIKGSTELMFQMCDGIITPNDAETIVRCANKRTGTIPMAIYHVCT